MERRKRIVIAVLIMFAVAATGVFGLVYNAAAEQDKGKGLGGSRQGGIGFQLDLMPSGGEYPPMLIHPETKKVIESAMGVIEEAGREVKQEEEAAKTLSSQQPAQEGTPAQETPKQQSPQQQQAPKQTTGAPQQQPPKQQTPPPTPPGVRPPPQSTPPQESPTPSSGGR